MQRVVLYATAGTNASAIASVLATLYETLGYEEAVILATSVSKKYADAAIRLVKSVLGGRERLRVECDASSCIMDRAPDEPSDVVNMLVGELKKILSEDGTVVVDITGGTKLMSALASIAAAIAARSRGAVLLSYVSSEGVDRLPGWWAGGYYPRIPRRLAKPIVYDLVGGVRRSVTPRPGALKPPQRIPALYYRAGRGLEPLRDAIGAFQHLLNALAAEKVDVYVRYGGASNLVHIASIEGLGYEGSVDLRINEDALGGVLAELGLVVEKSGGRVVGLDVGELVSMIGYHALEVAKFTNCRLVERGVRLLEVIRRCSESGECTVWMDTNIAYRGVHNDIYELQYRLVLSGVRRFDVRAEFPRCALREAVVRYAENVKAVRKGVLDARYGSALMDAVAAMAAEEFGVSEGGGPGTCDAEMLIAAREDRGHNLILVTSDEGAYQLWSDSGLCAVLVKATRVYTGEGDALAEKAYRLRKLAAAAQLIAMLAHVAVTGRAELVLEDGERKGRRAVVVNHGGELRVQTAEGS